MRAPVGVITLASITLLWACSDSITNPNDLPVVDAYAPSTVKINVPAEFTGTVTDDGIVVLFEWDFDGDGTTDWSSDTTANSTQTYTTAGPYQAILRATDNDDGIGTDTVEVLVTDESPPLIRAIRPL